MYSHRFSAAKHSAARCWSRNSMPPVQRRSRWSSPVLSL